MLDIVRGTDVLYAGELFLSAGTSQTGRVLQTKGVTPNSVLDVTPKNLEGAKLYTVSNVFFVCGTNTITVTHDSATIGSGGAKFHVVVYGSVE